VLALFLGAWSDRHGRKLPLLLGLVGKLYYSIMIIINALQGKCNIQTDFQKSNLPFFLASFLYF
jgi:PCFT/HCP family folate transporter-like MFS transporter 1/3